MQRKMKRYSTSALSRRQVHPVVTWHSPRSDVSPSLSLRGNPGYRERTPDRAPHSVGMRVSHQASTYQFYCGNSVLTSGPKGEATSVAAKGCDSGLAL